jgi:putative transposase
MARLPRLTLADMPHHVIQRGNNRQPIFVDRADHEKLLGLLAENAARFGIALHAYVLMDNHFHLLATPDSTTGLPQFMQSVGAATCATSTTAMAAAARCGKGATGRR